MSDRGRLQAKSFFSLKTSVLLTIIILWTAGIVTALVRGAGTPGGFRSAQSTQVVVSVCMTASAFCLLVATIPWIRGIVVDPARKADFRSIEFVVAALVCAIIAAGAFFAPGHANV